MTTNDAAERLPTAFVRFKANMTPENVREFRETWDAALAYAEGKAAASAYLRGQADARRATVDRIRAALDSDTTPIAVQGGFAEVAVMRRILDAILDAEAER